MLHQGTTVVLGEKPSTLFSFPTHLGWYVVIAAALPQVAAGSMDRDRTGGGDSKEITGLKFKVVEYQVTVHAVIYLKKYFAASKFPSTASLDIGVPTSVSLPTP